MRRFDLQKLSDHQLELMYISWFNKKPFNLSREGLINSMANPLFPIDKKTRNLYDDLLKMQK